MVASISVLGRDGLVEQGDERALVDVARYERLADAARENEGEAARFGLLVAAHVVDQPGRAPAASIVAADGAQAYRQPDGCEMPAHALGLGFGAEAKSGRQIEGHG